MRGKGDPTMTTERLYQVVGELKHLGLHEVADIVLDDSYFDAERLAPGFEQETTDRPYTAPTGALSLNANTVAVYLRSTGAGQRPAVEVDPSSDYFTVVNGAVGTLSRARRVSVSSELDGERQELWAGDGATKRGVGGVPTHRRAAFVLRANFENAARAARGARQREGAAGKRARAHQTSLRGPERHL